MCREEGKKWGRNKDNNEALRKKVMLSLRGMSCGCPVTLRGFSSFFSPNSSVHTIFKWKRLERGIINAGKELELMEKSPYRQKNGFVPCSSNWKKHHFLLLEVCVVTFMAYFWIKGKVFLFNLITEEETNNSSSLVCLSLTYLKKKTLVYNKPTPIWHIP